ncbi:histone H1-I isoform X2 [Cephus cinctus]|nr:histone H1-I isoform X2 [Cephus cinctus]
MAPSRRNAKRVDEEPVEVVASASNVSPPKKKRGQQLTASQVVENVREVRLPRAAKNKKAEPDNITVDAEPRVKKPTARSKAVPKISNSVTESKPAKVAKGLSKKLKSVEDEPSGSVPVAAVKKTKAAANDATEGQPVKKPRGKAAGAAKMTKTDDAEKGSLSKGKAKKNAEEKLSDAAKKPAAKAKAAPKKIESKEAKPKGRSTKKIIEEEEDSEAEPSKESVRGRGKGGAGDLPGEKDVTKLAKGRQVKTEENTTASKATAKKGRGKKATDALPIVDSTDIKLEDVPMEHDADEASPDEDIETADSGTEPKENGNTAVVQENGSGEMEEQILDEPKEVKKGKSKPSSKKGKSATKIKYDETDSDTQTTENNIAKNDVE